MSRNVATNRRAQSWGKGQRRLARPLASKVVPRALRGNRGPVGVTPFGRPAGTRGGRGTVGPRQLGGPVRALRRSRRATTRRRNVLAGLLAALVACAALALVTGAAGAWWASLGLVLLAAGYLVLLNRARRLEAEREFHLAFLPARMGASRLEELFSRSGPAEVGVAAGGSAGRVRASG
ncbi:MAG: hypothetical protein ACYCXN_00530 [Acidimicrobiales bacterium]